MIPSPALRKAAWATALLVSGLAWGGAAWLGAERGREGEAAARATAARAAAAGRALLMPALDSAAEALAAAEGRNAALLRGDRIAQSAAERGVAEALRRDGLQFAAVTDAAGRIAWATHAPLVGQSLAEREAFAQHRGGRAEPMLAPALLDLPGGPRSLLLTRPLTEPRGGFAGIALVAIDPRRLERLLADAALLPGLRMGLLRVDGTPLAAGGGPTLPWPPAGNDSVQATVPLPGGDVLLLAALAGDGRGAAREYALLLQALAALASLVALGLPLLLRRHPAPRAPAAPALDEAIPAVGYRGLVEPGGTLRLVEIGAGIERLTGWTPEAALRPGWRQRGIDAATLPLGADLPDLLRREAQGSTEYRFRRADGGWMWLRETGRVLGRGPAGTEVAGALEDISAERELALQAAAAAKFATLGEMAAGLAHELNQPIAIMSLAAENAAEALESGEDGVEDALARLRRIMAQADRAKAIVTQLRAFSRVDVATLEAVDLGAAVQGMMVLAGQALRDAGVQAQIRLPDLLPPVIGQAVLVEQVLLNIVLNARDALAESAPDRRRIRLDAEAGPGAEEVILRVQDSGPGIPAEVLERLFEPFYTTKPPGLGTGLGLSISRTIMRGIGGRIEAANLPGGGAVFTLVFRRAAMAQPPPAGQAAAPGPRWPAATEG
ncbi:ATP-binding protein [Falsiroseomonas sp. CW058]|uniref:ATP-binding protein n=1 Tax=Falsiroseomonas sp. CW058 TaxID=3388664 RepID=UPI003D319FEC